MALIQVCISDGPRADDIIKRMRKLLKARHFRRVSRRVFLAKWHSLRRALSFTPEYQAFRDAVWRRASGKCEVCGGPGRHVHHHRRVSRNPGAALNPKNGQLVCMDCHGRKPGHGGMK